MKSEIICIDLDNTISTESDDYERCIPKEHAIKALTMLRAENNFIVIYTGRHVNHARFTIEWLRFHKIPYDHIVFGKPPARLYIDDRAYRFKTWGHFLKDIYQIKVDIAKEDPYLVYERVLLENLKASSLDTGTKGLRELTEAMARARKIASS